MLESNGKKRTPQEELVFWIRERESVRIKKEAGLPKPWSDDPIFQQTYFCNVRREDDRVTRWIRTRWNSDYLGWDEYEYSILLSRFINWPTTLEQLSLPATPLEVESTMEALAAGGIKVWGNAYVITTHGIKMPKVRYLTRRVLPAAYELLGAGRWRGAYGSRPTLAARHQDLTRLEGVGSFIGAQIIADLKNTVGHPLYTAKDWSTWSAPGPGSMRGLNWFYGHSVTERQYEGYMNSVVEYLLDYPDVMEILEQNHTGRINMQDLQNALCEYDKYLRVKNGTGHSKRKYNGA